MASRASHWITTATGDAAALAAALSLALEVTAPPAGPAASHIAAAWRTPTL